MWIWPFRHVDSVVLELYTEYGSNIASRFDSIRIGRPDSIRFESDGPIRKFRIAAPATFGVVL